MTGDKREAFLLSPVTCHVLDVVSCDARGSILLFCPNVMCSDLDLEELDEKQLDRIRANYEKIAKKTGENLQHGKFDTDAPDVESDNTA